MPPIVRHDKREAATQRLRGLQGMVDKLLRVVNDLQAEIETIHVELGLANEAQLGQRDQCIVMHYREGEATGHPLDECSAECPNDEVGQLINDLVNNAAPDASDPENSEPETSDLDEGS